MMKVLPDPGCNDPVRAQSVVRSSQARGGSPAHAGRVRPAACSLCMGLRSAWSLHIQIRPSSTSGSGTCNRARWRGCVSYFTLATFSGRAAATRPREGPMVRIHLPPAVSLRTFGSGGELPPRDDIVLDAFLGQVTVAKRQPTGGGLRVRIQFPPAVSHERFGGRSLPERTPQRTPSFHCT